MKLDRAAPIARDGVCNRLFYSSAFFKRNTLQPNLELRAMARFCTVESVRPLIPYGRTRSEIKLPDSQPRRTTGELKPRAVVCDQALCGNACCDVILDHHETKRDTLLTEKRL